MYTVYSITNKKNKKRYIGRTQRPIGWRIKEHISALKKNRHHNAMLQEDFNRYGLENFTFSILESKAESNDCGSESEREWVEFYKTFLFENGYNTGDYGFLRRRSNGV